MIVQNYQKRSQSTAVEPMRHSKRLKISKTRGHNLAQFHAPRPGALVYITLHWTSDHHRLINRLDGVKWRKMHLQSEASHTTYNVIIEHHIERQTMNGVVSRKAVQQRMRLLRCLL